MKFFPFACIAALTQFYNAGIVWAQTVAPAPATPPHPPSLFELIFQMFPMFVAVFFIFYFLVLRPQQMKIKSQEDLIKSLKKGDPIVTSSGIIGRVAGFEKGYILLEVSNNVRIKLENSHIAKRVERDKEEVEKAVSS